MLLEAMPAPAGQEEQQVQSTRRHQHAGQIPPMLFEAV
jgi:hypothetical protein